MIDLEAVAKFVRESNAIEGITRPPRVAEVEAHEHLLELDVLKVADLERFVETCQPGARLRERKGMDVRVANHIPPLGGPAVRRGLEDILTTANSLRFPGLDAETRRIFEVHLRYETLHPFMDGNGRSGRALLLWQLGRPPRGISFLHWWYYKSLDFYGGRRLGVSE